MDTQNTGAQAPTQEAQAPTQAQPNPTMQAGNPSTPDAAPQASPQGMPEPQAAPPVQGQQEQSVNQIAQTVQPDIQKDMAGTIAAGFLAGELVAVLVLVISLWKIFTKASEAGWKCLIPVYNFWVLLKITRLPGYYFILLLIPLINIFASIRMAKRLSTSFGRGTGFTVGLIFLPFIFYPILAFGKSEYSAIE